MTPEEYDEIKVLNEYLTRNFRNLMTELEHRSYDLAIKREKAKQSNVAADRLPAWIAAAGDQAARMSLEPHILVTKFRERILRDVRGGQIVINRCPQCSRIVKTPLARQCLWCGHDWHDT